MLSLNNENINYVMTQNLKLSCVSFSYVSIRYVLALNRYVVLCTVFFIHRKSMTPKKGEHITDIYITETGTTELENLSHNIIDIFITET